MPKTAPALMNPDVVTVRADTTIDVCCATCACAAKLPDHTDHILWQSASATNIRGRIACRPCSPTGTPSASCWTTSSRPLAWTKVRTGGPPVLRPRLDQRAGGDGSNILLGRITIDDVVDIIRAQAEHGDVGRPRRGTRTCSRRCGAHFRRRLIWLAINLATAFPASVVNQFPKAPSHLVSLAVLMPIVAGMGGNAGAAVLALMVRGLALGQIGGTNIGALVWKEVRIAIINGIGIGLLLALIVLLWFHTRYLSLVIALALTINFTAAALGTRVCAPVTVSSAS